MTNQGKHHSSILRVPKRLVRELGIANALLLTYIVQEQKEAGSNDLTLPVAVVERELGMNDHAQRKHLRELESLGYIRVYRRGDVHIDGDANYRAARRHVAVLPSNLNKGGVPITTSGSRLIERTCKGGRGYPSCKG